MFCCAWIKHQSFTFCSLQVKVTQELKNTHTEQMTRLHFKHQSECDLLEDMRYEHICITGMCWHCSSSAKTVKEYAYWSVTVTCMLCTHGHCRALKKNERRKRLMTVEGWHGREKEEEEEYCHFPVLGEGHRVRKMMKEFPAGLFLLFDRFFVLFRISFFISVIFSFPCFLFSFPLALTVFFVTLHISASRSGLALFTHGVRECGSFPFRFWQREETLVLLQALISVLTKNWLFMTTNSVTLCSFVSIPVLLPVFSFSHSLLSRRLSLLFLSPSPLSYSRGLLQLFENRLLCCCWSSESEQDPGLTGGREGEPV